MKILKFINELRDSDEYIKHIYMEGSCYKFYILLSKMYKTTIPYISIKKDHIIPRNIINISPIRYNPETREPVRGIIYSVDGERKYDIIDEGHPLWCS